jgi:hypothetical protein
MIRPFAISIVFVVACIAAGTSVADDQPLPLLFADDFEGTAKSWRPTDAAAWQVQEVDRDARGKPGKAYRLLMQSKYEPPHRSPFNFSLVERVDATDFTLEANVRSTFKDYDHRDMVAVFGYQDSAHFYYVHFGKKADDHANQIFIVNDAPRVKISRLTSAGTNWDDDWHKIKISRDVESGAIDVYFDDMDKPVMHAEDQTFSHGQVGVGSFDDTGDWDDVEVRGKKATD